MTDYIFNATETQLDYIKMGSSIPIPIYFYNNNI